MPGLTSSGMPSNVNHSFSQVPGIEKPRSTMGRSSTHKTTFEADYWIPLYWDEVLPGDTHQVDANVFMRLLGALQQPIMDNLFFDWVAVYCPNRILWDNFVYQQGENDDAGAQTTEYLTPVMNDLSNSDMLPHTLSNYLMALDPDTLSGSVSPSSYLWRFYNKFCNQWSRDQNLIDSYHTDTGDGPDDIANYSLIKRTKRLDLITGCLPYAQKGTPVDLPITGTANIISTGQPFYLQAAAGLQLVTASIAAANSPMLIADNTGGSGDDQTIFGPYGQVVNSIAADMNSISGITLNDFRLLATTQQMLELDARGGTRFTEITRNHFGVISPDARLQRVEYLRGGTIPILVHPVANTAGSGGPVQGSLAAFSTGSGSIHFTSSFVEHGHIMVLGNVRADLTYSQRLDKAFSRATRFDYYFPIFANIGEQPMLNQEVYCVGDAGGAGTDLEVFGYQEYAAEYRWKPSTISGYFQTRTMGSLDFWHLSEYFMSRPTLSQSFIESNAGPQISRVVADEAEPYIIYDSSWSNKTTRVMPMFSIPGLRRI